VLHLEAVDSTGMGVLTRGHEVRTDKVVGHRRASQATGIHKENRSDVTGWFCQDSGFSRWRSTVEELDMDFNLKGTESK
jgi:hypothetical protein